MEYTVSIDILGLRYSPEPIRFMTSDLVGLSTFSIVVIDNVISFPWIFSMVFKFLCTEGSVRSSIEKRVRLYYIVGARSLYVN